MRFRALAVTLMSVLTVAVAPSAQAQLIYDNGAPNWLDGNEMTQWIQAEDFTLTGAATIVGVRFWAISNVGDAWAGSAWYQFYSNSGGVPGALLASGSFVPTFASITCGFSGCFQLDFDLGAGLPLGPGTYFLGLHNGDLSETGRRSSTGPRQARTRQGRVRRTKHRSARAAGSTMVSSTPSSFMAANRPSRSRQPCCCSRPAWSAWAQPGCSGGGAERELAMISSRRPGEVPGAFVIRQSRIRSRLHKHNPVRWIMRFLPLDHIPQLVAFGVVLALAAIPVVYVAGTYASGNK